MVLPDSHGVSRAPRYSGTALAALRVQVRGFHPLWRAFPDASPAYSRAILAALQPPTDESAGFGLFPFRSPLLWESRLISSPAGTEMFHFPAFASARYAFTRGCRAMARPVAPFRNPRVKGYSAPRRGLSQPVTSFIAFRRQGIRLSPFLFLFFLTSFSRLKTQLAPRPQTVFPSLCNCQ